MSAQGLEVIDHTVQLTHEWINELRDRLGWTSSRDTFRLLRVTLTALRDRLSVEEAAQFSAQMPLLIRGVFYEGWRPRQQQDRQRDLARFVLQIESHVADVQDYRGTEDISAVFDLLNNRISAGEVQDVRACLPDAIRGIWRSP